MARSLLCGAIVAGHLGTVELLGSQIARPMAAASPVSEQYMSAALLFQSPHWDATPMPEAQLQWIQVDLAGLEVVRFDESDDDWLSGIHAPSSAPRLRRIQLVDVQQYERRANPPAGRASTTVLSLEIDPGGSVRSANVVRSCGISRIDSLAIQYALQLKWYPGTVERHPTSMRVIYPVTFVAAPSRPRRSEFAHS